MKDYKKIFVLGFARSGYSASKLLALKGKEVLVTDMNVQDKEKIEEIKKLGVTYIETKDQASLLDSSYDLVVKNPGIKEDNKVIKKARELGIPVVNEIEMAYNYLPKDVFIIGITGSNGKTTTTTLIYEIIKKSNKRVHLAGNIGYPLSSVIPLIKEKDILVIEISSFQLLNFDKFKTNISLITNFSKAHLDVFESYENYLEVKKRIINHHTKKDILILNKDDFDSEDLFKDYIGEKRFFSVKKKTDGYVSGKYIYYKGKEITSLDKLKIMGAHNYENIAAAITASKEVFVSDEVIKEVIENFKGIEHRIEYVDVINERTFYNDAKSTNPKSTTTALKTLKKPVLLLLGGIDRGEDFLELRRYKKYIKKIYCYGETRFKIERFCLRNNVPYVMLNNLKEATKEAYLKSEKGDIILLSPACGSKDQFKDFEERGNFFKKEIEGLKN